MKYGNIVARMTIEEKAAILSGRNEWQTWDFPRLAIPSLFFSDGPSGVRRQDGAGDHLGLNPSLPATCFPSASSIANSWDTSLAEEIGHALGDEAGSLGVDVLLGPGLNMKRSPLCGRNFEYFSEDPYLAGKLAAAYIRGIQGEGVGACPKHFAVNSQELRRMSVNSVLDERTLREIYLTGFEIAIKEGRPKSIMTSYNGVNGTYANENSHLLKDILRGEWGFEGFVVTDWGGSNDHVQGVAAGSDLEMPNPGLDSARQLRKAVEEGRLSEGQIDLCVDRLLDAAFTLSHREEPERKIHREAEHHALAAKAARESAVLLKNEDGVLPIAEGTKVAVIGYFAKNPRYQGTGSSQVNASRVEEIQEKMKDYPLDVVGIADGYGKTAAKKVTMAGKASSGAARDVSLASEAVSLAAKADVVLYFLGLDDFSETEGRDRENMRIPREQLALLDELAKVNLNLVGILSGGSPVEMEWEGRCKAILHGYLAGQAGAGAILDILTGKACPSGKLAETYPLRYEDTPAYAHFPSRERNAEYREGLYIGYRYYDTAKVPVRYPFGYGLSYTSFKYSGLIIGKGGIRFTIKNTGSRDGAEIAQMYVSLPGAEVFRPEKELKGFVKVFLKAGECREVKIPFNDKTFRYWNIKTGRWETERGEYRILVGASAADIRLAGSLRLTDGSQLESGAEESGLRFTAEFPYQKEELPSYYSGKVQRVGDAEFATLLGGPIPDGAWHGELEINDPLGQMCHAKNALARLAWKILARKKEKSEAAGMPDLNIQFIYNLPFRGIAKMTEGMVSMEMAEGLVTAVNGHFFRGMARVISGYFRNRKANKLYREKMEEDL